MIIKGLMVTDFITLTAAALGLIVNCATLVALLLNRQRLTAKANLVLSLTLGSIVTVAGSMLHTLYNQQTVGGIFCLSGVQVLIHDVKYVGIIVTVLGLNALCVDLYVAVMHSMRYRVLCRKRRVRVIICIKWLVGALLGTVSSMRHLLAAAMQASQAQQHCATFLPMPIVERYNRNESVETFDASGLHELAVNLTLPVLGVRPIIPSLPTMPIADIAVLRFYISDCVLLAVLAFSVLFISLSLARIYRKLKSRVRRPCGRHSGALESSSGAYSTAGSSSGIRRHSSVSGSRSKRRGAFTILVLFLGFNVTVLPYLVGELYSILILSQVQSLDAQSVEYDLNFINYAMPHLAALAVSYTVLNPVVLSLRMREVQAGYVMMCRRLRRKSQSSHAAAQSAATGRQGGGRGGGILTAPGDHPRSHGPIGARGRTHSGSNSVRSLGVVSFGGGGASCALGYSEFQDTEA